MLEIFRNERSMLNIRTIFFDLDGTLIDTEPSAIEALKNCFLQWKMPLDTEDLAHMMGRTWESGFARLFQKYTPPLPQEEAKKKILATYRSLVRSHLVAVPGSVQAVIDLAKHFPLALVSGSKRSDILWSLETLKIQDHFQCILGAEDYPQSKPAPDGYQKALQLLKAQPENTLIFEDSHVGLRSAQAVGAWVVAVTYSNPFHEDISQAHFKIPDLKMVSRAWVENLKSPCNNDR
jgi:beta-phosphoglucomutase